MKAAQNHKRIISVVFVVIACLTIPLLWWAYKRMHRFGLPYKDSFARQKVGEWTPYGGSWRLANGTVTAHSTERGAKLVTGSSEWSAYQVTADVQLHGHGGDLGIAVRVNEPRIGIDAYHGYFAGLKFYDSSLTIGRADGHWLSGGPVYVQGGVRYNQWYRMHVVVVGCKIAVELMTPGSGRKTFAGLDDSGAHCIHKGKIALRTTDTNGAWKNISVRVATTRDLDDVMKGHPFDTPRFPIRERDYNAMRKQYLASIPYSYSMTLGVEGSQTSPMAHDDAPVVRIDELHAYLWNDSPVRVIGTVTSSDPLYIQDSTGGIRLEARDRNVSLQVGDEVEVLGHPSTKHGPLRLVATATRSLWDVASVIAFSTTATQAATGRYDGSLIEVSGILRKKRKLPDGKNELLLQDGSQSFVVRLPFDLFKTSADNLEIGSRLKVHGICSTTEPRSWSDESAFVVLAGASSDVVLLAGPPWWTGARLVWLLCGMLGLIGLGVYMLIAVERLKHRIVHEERQRLSHEMHDTLAQSLAGVGFKLQAIRRTMRQHGSVPEPILEAIDTTYDVVAGTHREASASIAALHPASQVDGELVTLLERSIFSMLDGDGIEVETEQTGEPRQLSPIVSDTLFRIGKEAIANTLRHARATRIKVSVAYRNRHLVLSVSDNGSGFLYVPDKRGFGLKSIERRCESIRAEVDVLSTPGHGTTVRITSPYRVHPLFSRWIRETVNRQS